MPGFARPLAFFTGLSRASSGVLSGQKRLIWSQPGVLLRQSGLVSRPKGPTLPLPRLLIPCRGLIPRLTRLLARRADPTYPPSRLIPSSIDPVSSPRASTIPPLAPAPCPDDGRRQGDLGTRKKSATEASRRCRLYFTWRETAGCRSLDRLRLSPFCDANAAARGMAILRTLFGRA